LLSWFIAPRDTRSSAQPAVVLEALDFDSKRFLSFSYFTCLRYIDLDVVINVIGSFAPVSAQVTMNSIL
jgi:hypothetical protein